MEKVEETRKRGRSESSVSSIEDSDTNKNTPNSESKKEKQIKKRGKKEKDEKKKQEHEVINEENEEEDTYEKTPSSEKTIVPNTSIDQIEKQLAMINEKLNNVVDKNDEYMKGIVTEIVKQVRGEITKVFEEKIEKLESRIFDAERENDKLREILDRQKNGKEEKDEENDQTIRNLEKMVINQAGKLNDLEQYGRRNNIVISGLKNDKKGSDELPENTMKKVIDDINKHMKGLNLADKDIDICHRLGQPNKDGKQPIIVKLQSRFKKIELLKRKKELKGTGIYINEDLSKLNRTVFGMMRRNITEGDSVWTREGTIFHKGNNGHVRRVPFAEYKYWLGSNWPSIINQ